ncbi:MAG: glucosamine-6-phosphate deaminase [Ilumatobacter sp.]|nr:MAG: glucosamine-6-phosphate deaminase [Ilumatobacter sp.]
MEVVVVESPEDIGASVASMVIGLLERRPAAVLGLAAGDSQVPVYEALIEAYRRGEVSFAEASAVTLDEYVGLPPGHSQSYRQSLIDAFVRRVDLPVSSLYTPDVHAADLGAACAEFEAQIARLGGVDLQLLGIGANGHIGFNEPGSSLASRTRVTALHPRTRDDNARFFANVDEVPYHVVTQGVGTVLDARHAVLIASGEHKREAVAAMVEGPVTASLPASALQLNPHATVVIDEASAAGLQQTEYHRFAHDHEPPGQQD